MNGIHRGMYVASLDQPAKHSKTIFVLQNNAQIANLSLVNPRAMLFLHVPCAPPKYRDGAKPNPEWRLLQYVNTLYKQ